MFIEPAELKRMVQESKASGMTGELCFTVQYMTRAIHNTFHFKISLDDYQQDCLLLVMLKLDSMDPDGPLFNFFTTMIANKGKETARTAGNHIKKCKQIFQKNVSKKRRKIKGDLFFDVEN